MSETLPSDWADIAPFAQTLGAVVKRASDGEAELFLPFAQSNANRKHDVHGGALGSLIDLVGSAALRSAEPELKGLATISMTVNFLVPARGDMTAIGKVVKSGRTIGWCECRIVDSQGQLVATASATYRIIR